MTLGLARPVWIDDRDFDITYHVRRSALPSPGSNAQLHELVARLGSRPLDKDRPLWEMSLVEGLANNRVAIYTKSHQALVNGMSALEIGHVIADRSPEPAGVRRGHLDTGRRTWRGLAGPCPPDRLSADDWSRILRTSSHKPLGAAPFDALVESLAQPEVAGRQAMLS